MNIIIAEYVEAGNALIEKSRLEKERQESQAQAKADLYHREFVARALAVAHAFIPTGLHGYLTVTDDRPHDTFANLSLALPDCYVITFQVYLPEKRLNGRFEIEQGKPFIDRDYDGYMCEQVIGHEYRDSVKSEILEYLIALAFKRQQSENELQFECDAYNERARQREEVKAERKTAQEPPPPTLEERLLAVLREFVESVNQ